MGRKLGNDVMENLIELVWQNPCIYDVTHAGHKDAVMNANVWNGVAETLAVSGMNGNDWKKKWRTQRDTYVRKKRLLNTDGSAAATASFKKWKFHGMLSFLDNHIQDTSADCKAWSDSDLDHTDDKADEQEYSVHDSPSQSLSPSSPSRTFHKYTLKGAAERERLSLKRKESNPLDSFTELAQAHKMHMQQHDVPKQRDAEDAFFESCAIRVKNLPLSKRGLVQLQISQILYSAENDECAPNYSLPTQVLLPSNLYKQSNPSASSLSSICQSETSEPSSSN